MKQQKPNSRSTAETKFTLWASRDKDNVLFQVWDEKPHKMKDFDGWCSRISTLRGSLDAELMPDLTYENSPCKIELTISKL